MAKIRITRKAYYRKPYRRADGVYVKGGYVKASSFLVNDPGKPGRRSRGTKAGKYRKAPKWITHEGALGGPGYAHKSDKTRHDLLKASVKRDGYATTIRRLYVLLRSSTMHPDARKVVKADVAWMKRGRELAKASAKKKSERRPKAGRSTGKTAGWVYLHGLNDKSFPNGNARYSVTSRDYSQDPATESHGHVDSFSQAKKFASDLIPNKADRVEIWDNKRGYMVAFKNAE